MSQVSCGELEVFAALVDGAVKAIEGGAQYGAGGCERFGDLGQSWAQPSGIGSAEEHRDLQALSGKLVAIGFSDTLDQAMQSETTQIVAHPTGAVALGILTEQCGEMSAQLCVVEPLCLHAEEHQRVEPGLGARVA